MKIVISIMLVLLVGACSWETYQDARGYTHLRQKYPMGSGVYYTKGAASQNTHYHDFRPEPHVVKSIGN